MPLELVCDVCEVCLQATTEDELVALGIRHALSIHGCSLPPEYVLTRIRNQNR
jgi:hypothetical protein